MSVWSLLCARSSRKIGKTTKPNRRDGNETPDRPERPDRLERPIMKLSRFEDLDCWKEARQLTRQVYEAIGQNPGWLKDSRLCGQIQGAACSVMANIAEGFVRHSDREFAQFLFIAMSSAAEVQSHLYVAVDRGYLSKETFESIYEQAGKTSRIISGLIKYLRRKTRRTK